jgi:DNA modification methylase
MVDLILFGDCRDTLKQFPRGSAQMCVTSPPYYGLRDYGGEENQIGMEQSPEEYVDQMVQVFREVRDVLTDDGVLWLNIGDSYYNYRSDGNYPKQSVSKTRQDLPKSTPVRGNKLKGLKQKDLIGIPWMLAFALRADGWYLRQDIIWHKPNPMPESVKDRCTKSHEYIFLLSKNQNYYYDNEAIKEPVKQDWGTRDRTKGKYHNPGTGLQPHSGLTKSYERKNKRSVWTVNKKPYKGAHFATYPEELIEPCILAGSREGDTILDPFMGSGTTAYVARKHDRHYLGCELHEDYGTLIQKRIKAIPTKLPML